MYLNRFIAAINPLSVCFSYCIFSSVPIALTQSILILSGVGLYGFVNCSGTIYPVHISLSPLNNLTGAYWLLMLNRSRSKSFPRSVSVAVELLIGSYTKFSSFPSTTKTLLAPSNSVTCPTYPSIYILTSYASFLQSLKCTLYLCPISPLNIVSFHVISYRYVHSLSTYTCLTIHCYMV